jgi:arginine transport system substrate-binding protein
MKKFILFLLAAFTFIVANANAEPPTPVQKLTFATEATYPPFESTDAKGRLQGFDIDIVNALCKEMHAQCTITNQAFDSLIPSLQLGKYSAIIGAMNITEERAKQVDFTQPYYKNTASIVTTAANAVQLNKALGGNTIGVQSGTTFIQYLNDTYGNSVTVNTYASAQAAFLDLTSGRIAAVMGDTPIIMTWLKKQKPGAYVLVGKPIDNEKYFGQGYGIAVRKGDVALLQQLNQAINTIKKNGAYNKIVQHYFGNNSK